MTSEVDERPRLVTGGYGRRRSQWVNLFHFIILVTSAVLFHEDPNKRLALFKKLEETNKLRDVKPPPTRRQPPNRVDYFAGEKCRYWLIDCQSSFKRRKPFRDARVVRLFLSLSRVTVVKPLTNWRQFFMRLSCYWSWIRHNIVKVVCRSTNRTDAWKIDVNLLSCNSKRSDCLLSLVGASHKL